MTNKAETVDAITVSENFEREFGDVFGISDEERERLKEYDARLMEFRPQLITSYLSLDRLNKETSERNDKLHTVLDDLREQSDLITMGQNASILYLVVLEVAAQSGWTQEQTQEVFEKQLEFNNDASKVTKGLNKKKLKSQLFDNRDIKAAYLRLGKKIPSWYKQSLNDWQNFIYNGFSRQGEIQKSILSGISTEVIGSIGGPYRITSDRTLPDWMIDRAEGEYPEKEMVENGLIEDERSKQKLVDQFRYVDSKVVHSTEIAISKGKKAIGRNTSVFRQLFPSDNLSLAQLVLFLADTDEMTYYDVDPEKIESMTPAQINHKALKDQAKEDWFIRRFAQTADISVEMVRLYLRKKFDEIKFFDGTNEDKRLKLAALLSTAKSNAQVQTLRQVDKKTAQRLNFDILPMLQAVDEDGINQMRDSFLDNPFALNNELISRLSDEMVNRLWSNGTDKELTRIKEDYKKFVVNWLRTHWREAYSALYFRLHKAGPFDIEPKSEPITEDITATGVDEAREIETAINEVKMGSLLDWSVCFDVNKNGDSKMELLEGDSLEALEDRLQALLLKHRISCSIKLSSVVHALEWAATLPQNKLQLMIRENIEGRDYLKIKRGNVRLFFQIDPREKRLVFFVYQKQSLSYRF